MFNLSLCESIFIKTFFFWELLTTSILKGILKIFNLALSLANAEVTNSIMIGDNYEADIQGALKIGLDAICFNYHKSTLPKTVKNVNFLLELKHYF